MIFNSRNTRHIIVNSEMVRREITERFRFPTERLHLVRNGVDTERFQQADRSRARTRWNLREEEFVLLFAGSGWERKGLKYLLQVVRRLPAEQVRLLGEQLIALTGASGSAALFVAGPA